MKFNLKRFIVSLLDKMFLPAPITPPAVVEMVAEDKLRAIYQLGVTAGLAKARKEQPVQSVIVMPTLEDAIAMIRTAPLAHETGPQKPIERIVRAGGLMHAQRAKERVAARLEAQQRRILPARPGRPEPVEKKPIFSSVPTRIEFSAILKSDLPEVG